MAENVLNNTTNAVFIPTIIAQKCLQRLPSYLNMAKTVSKDSDWATAQIGDKIQVPKTGAVTANDKVAGVAFTKQNPTGTYEEVTLDKHKEVTFTIDDVTKVFENQDTQMRYGEDGAIALSEAIEQSLVDLHPQITNTLTWNRTSETTIDTSMLAIRKFFTDQKVPKLEQKYFYCDSTIYNDLLGTDKFSRYDATGKQGQITEGEMIKAYSMLVSESQMIPTSGSPVAYHNFAYSKNGMVLATRALPTPKGFSGYSAVINDPLTGITLRSMFWYNADIGAHQLTLDVLFGVAILDDRRLVEVESF
ncbi:hypothetical protein KKB83_04240 [Patescibacteria group bacterium]|nr:hypothetical protein [Patescibacteria group bacterium]